MSGANSTPLGRMNPAIGSGKRSGSSLLNPSYMSSASNGSDSKRDSSPETKDSRDRKKKRRSRWQGDEKEKTFIPGMPTMLPSNMSKEQEEAYLLQLQIEELSRRLRTNEMGYSLNPEERSPSPEPIYNSEGKRLNTREYRVRKKLEDARHEAITKMLMINADYKPPADYKAPIVKVSDKVMIPQDSHPDINFVGLLIGPRGNTLKSMEKETGAKIIIRGKGSVKEGKVGRKDGGPMPGEDEPLHAYVTANNPECVKKAVDKIKEIIRQGVEVPEGENDLRRMQLRELALLNGTLRENDAPRCSNCGCPTHKSWQCPDKPNVTNSVLCTNCGATGHIAKDCRQKPSGGMVPGMQSVDRQKIDEEYMSLMAELGEGPPPPHASNGTKSLPNSGAQRSLFDRPIGPPRPLMPPSQKAEGGFGPGGPPNSWSSGGAPGRPNQGNWNQPGGGLGPQSASQFVPRPLMTGSSSNNPNLNHPPPGMPQWQSQGGSQSSSGGFQGVPPPNLLQAPPPPPPPSQSNQQNRPQVQNWIGQAPPGPPTSSQGPPPMNSWHGGPPPSGMGCPPPGPVPPPRPVGPPPSWGWNGPNRVGPPPPPPGGPPSRSGVDLGALLSAPPPPPPS